MALKVISRSQNQSPNLRNVRRRSCLFEGWARLWELHALGLIQAFRRDVQPLLQRYIFDKNPNTYWPITEIAIPTILQLLAGQKHEFQLPLIRNPEEKITRKTIAQHL